MKVIDEWGDDELEGWDLPMDGYYGKKIDGHYFNIYETPDGFAVHMPQPAIATRPTLADCQHLAHATARLWAGETPDV